MFLFVNVVLILLWGKILDIFGCKFMFLFVNVIFMIGFFICVVFNNIGMFIVGCVV